MKHVTSTYRQQIENALHILATIPVFVLYELEPRMPPIDVPIGVYVYIYLYVCVYLYECARAKLPFMRMAGKWTVLTPEAFSLTVNGK